MPGLLRCTCGDYTRVLTTHCTRGCGCIARPAFPAPSVLLGERFLQNLGRIAPRECGCISGFDVIARSKATKQSLLTSRQHRLLRGACHRARIRATRWLAMTVSKPLCVLAV